MKTILRSITREKHLDHMVKVTPLIFLGFGLQSYILLSMNYSGSIIQHLLGLAFALASMITFFMIHDVYHQVHFYSDHFESGLSFMGTKKSISYNDIQSITVSEKDQRFATLTIHTRQMKKISFYFVDAPEEIKVWIENHKEFAPAFSAAA